MSNIDFISAPADIKLSDHQFDYRTGNPAVYVGTYKKYNEGSLFGMWLDLSTFEDFDEFYMACRILHEDESDPEFMFQDYEAFPESWYSESGLCSREKFELIKMYSELDDNEKAAFDAYLGLHGSNMDDESVFDDFREKFVGEYDSEEDFAYQLAEETCMFDQVPESVKMYFDYKAFARDLFMGDYDFESGYVFRCY